MAGPQTFASATSPDTRDGMSAVLLQHSQHFWEGPPMWQ